MREEEWLLGNNYHHLIYLFFIRGSRSIAPLTLTLPEILYVTFIGLLS